MRKVVLEEQAAFDGFHPDQPGQDGHQHGGEGDDADDGCDDYLTGGLGRGAIFCMAGGSIGGKAGNWPFWWVCGSKVGRLGCEE